MYYQIADVILRSALVLPSFAAFACAPAEPDMTLDLTNEKVPAGKEIISGDFVHRVLPDGWFCHGPGGDSEGLFISADYSSLRYRGRKGVRAARSAVKYVRMAIECLLIRKGFVPIHAAAVALDGAAYAFTGPSGVGKSTRARLWIDTLGAELISGDRPLIRVRTMELYGAPWDGKERCFSNVRFPLNLICEVRRGDSFHARKLTPSQNRRLLVRQCFIPMWDTETSLIQIRNITELSAKAEILRVFGGKAPEDAAALREAIREKRYLKEQPDMKAKPGFVLREIVNEHILMPIDENIGNYNGAILLNSVSAFIWEKLQDDISREDLLTAILDAFDVDEATAAKDLDALLDRLNEMKLIEGV